MNVKETTPASGESMLGNEATSTNQTPAQGQTRLGKPKWCREIGQLFDVPNKPGAVRVYTLVRGVVSTSAGQQLCVYDCLSYGTIFAEKAETLAELGIDRTRADKYESDLLVRLLGLGFTMQEITQLDQVGVQILAMSIPGQAFASRALHALAKHCTEQRPAYSRWCKLLALLFQDAEVAYTRHFAWHRHRIVSATGQEQFVYQLFPNIEAMTHLASQMNHCGTYPACLEDNQDDDESVVEPEEYDDEDGQEDA